ncbi:Methyltransferase domain-containing protein [Marinobacter gudaonensis]|uniref:Methyltransferase domain-containing protein n=1 Tax=Marinobacter gudaonensis TaxID=375760 RepID=A0A1I6G5F2_9GAMM|nr:class I SAM-dependent methyltransferase [Marinobacter gudaonensis]SFR37392.1 Methyltransferase domain-containing protein [Marinobacter gudaonensis]
MRYLVDGVEIRSENAAKPASQKSAAVDFYLASLEGRPKLLDFGCGKLRYSDTLVEVASTVTFVDSFVQLNREQVVRGGKTTVRAFVRSNYSNCQTISSEEIDNHFEKYDVVTCTNVLSAIPCPATLTQVVGSIRRLLKAGGMAVFVNQHRSSYFKRYELGERLLYGYLYEGKRGYSYYGILGKKNIENLLRENGFYINRSWCAGETTFTEASPCR